MTVRRKKPALTFYTDYVIKDGVCYGIFETKDSRVHTKVFFDSDKEMVSGYRETKHFLILTK